MIQGVFLHIPRTGSFSRNYNDRFEKVWSESDEDIPTKCPIYAMLRNETSRYCSEWNVAKNYFKTEDTFKGWIPLSYPKTFEEFSNDESTHNAMVRILSGCQLYDETCNPTYQTMMNVFEKIQNGCINIISHETYSVNSYPQPYKCSDEELEISYRVNHLDRLLLEKLRSINYNEFDTGTLSKRNKRNKRKRS